MVKNASCQCQGERQADVRFPRKSILFPCYIKELSIHVHCVCLAESINKWVERMAVRGGWRPLSGLICEIVNSVGQENFTFVREKSGKSQGISNTYGCGNHVLPLLWGFVNCKFFLTHCLIFFICASCAYTTMEKS